MSREWRWRIGRFLLRAAGICMAAGLLLLLPEPQHDNVIRYKDAAVALLTVIALGVALFDTFFYERYPY